MLLMGKFGLFLLRVEEHSKSTGITGRGKLLGWKMLQEEGEEYPAGSSKRKENKGGWNWGMKANVVGNIWKRV